MLSLSSLTPPPPPLVILRQSRRLSRVDCRDSVPITLSTVTLHCLSTFILEVWGPLSAAVFPRFARLHPRSMRKDHSANAHTFPDPFIESILPLQQQVYWQSTADPLKKIIRSVFWLSL